MSDAEDVLETVDVDPTTRRAARLIPPSVADPDPQAVDEHDRVDLVDRAGLPGPELVGDHLRDLRDGVVGDLVP